MLNNYLRDRAGQDTRSHASVCYILRQQDSPSICGYYTLSATSIELGHLPAAVAKRLPRYPHVPAALIGRLAVDRLHHGSGYGGLLVADALARCRRLSGSLGMVAVLVDAKNPAAELFYAHYGFAQLEGVNRRMFIPI